MPDPVVVVFTETGRERTVKRGCAICDPTAYELEHPPIVSPRGIVHVGADYGETDCGRDATAPGWWWAE